jgi:nucleoside-diphosphate-sugar epimerase
MNVCVVGGTGNISTSIVRLLLEAGHEVTCFNRGRSGALPDGVRRIAGDRKDREAFERVLRAENFDAAIDMICFTKEDALSSLRAFPDVAHFVHCSTVATHGIQYDWYPATEDHPLRPITPYGRGKVEADAAYMEAYYRDGFPVTIIKPSTTYGPKMGLIRQVAWDFTWLDRIRKGKPLLVCGDGNALHQFLHVDDAALGFVHVLGRERTLGQTYHLVERGCTTWAEHHRTAMRVLGREVELVGVPFADLAAADIPNFGICRDIFAHHIWYSGEKVARDVPEFRPRVSLEQGMAQVLAAMERSGRIPDSDEVAWEDRIIAAQRAVRKAVVG